MFNIHEWLDRVIRILVSREYTKARVEFSRELARNRMAIKALESVFTNTDEFREDGNKSYPDTVTVTSTTIVKDILEDGCYEQELRIDTDKGVSWIDAYIGIVPKDDWVQVGDVLHKRLRGARRFVWYEKAESTDAVQSGV